MSGAMLTDWDPNREGPQYEPDGKPAKAKVTTGGGRPGAYRLKDGTRVPGVTTISNKYKDPGALMAWAHKLGLEGKDFRAARDEAGAAGHLAHAWIEDSIHGLDPRKPPPLSESVTELAIEQAQTAFEAFLEWRSMVELSVIDTERPLVSELHRIGGTFDALAIVKGKVTLLDWKSGGGVYPEVIAQLAAYRQLIRETCGNRRDLAPERACCLRVGKNSGDFHYHMYPSEILDAGWRRFMASKEMYEVDKDLSKVCQ
jgi:hypothetical protein